MTNPDQPDQPDRVEHRLERTYEVAAIGCSRLYEAGLKTITDLL